MGISANTAPSNAAQEAHGRNLIVFDDVCVLCSGFARFVVKHDKDGGFAFVSAHSKLGRDFYQRDNLDPDKMETNIVIIRGQSHVKMASFTAVMSELGWPWRAFSVLNLLPKFVSDRLYDLIASHRYRFGRRSCPLPSKELKGRIL